MASHFVPQCDEVGANSPTLNERKALNIPEQRRASRVVYVPREPKEVSPPDSTRILLLATGRIGVVFATGPDGRRRQRAVDTLTEAQELVAASRRVG